MTYEVLEQINAMADDIFAEGIEAERNSAGWPTIPPRR